MSQIITHQKAAIDRHGTTPHALRYAVRSAPRPRVPGWRGTVSRARESAESRVPTCDVVVEGGLVGRSGVWAWVWGCSNKTSLSLTLYTVL